MSRSSGSWALVATVSGSLVALAVLATAAMAIATVGAEDAPPTVSDSVFYGASVVMWGAVGWVSGFVSGLLGHPRGARWVGVSLLAALAVAHAAEGDSAVLPWIAVVAALVAASIVVGSRFARSVAVGQPQA